MHGYELRERLGAGLGAFWRIASSQLYGVLHRLEEAGWVDGDVASGVSGPSRVVYRATEQGEYAFWAWAGTPVRSIRRFRVEFPAKLYFLRRLAPDRIDPLVARQTAWLRQLAEKMEQRPRLHLDDPDLADLIASYRLHRVHGTLRWLEKERGRMTAKKERA